MYGKISPVIMERLGRLERQEVSVVGRGSGYFRPGVRQKGIGSIASVQPAVRSRPFGKGKIYGTGVGLFRMD